MFKFCANSVKIENHQMKSEYKANEKTIYAHHSIAGSCTILWGSTLRDVCLLKNGETLINNSFKIVLKIIKCIPQGDS